MRGRLASLALLAAALIGLLPGCAHVLGPADPSDWPPEVARDYPAGAVAIDGGRVIDLSAWLANGVIVHSSRERGTFALTNEHVARLVARSGGATVRVPDLARGTMRSFAATAFAPSVEEMERAERESSGDETADAIRALIAQLERLFADVALIRVETAGALLEVAPLGADRPETAPEPFRAFPIYPARRPGVLALGRPTGYQVSASGLTPELGMSGSAIFDGAGRVHGLLSWKRRGAVDEVGITTLERLVGWLRERGLAWVSAHTLVDPEAVARLERARDVAALRRTAADTERVYHDLRAEAVRALGRLRALDHDGAWELVERDVDPGVRAAAIAVAFARDADRADPRAAALIGERSHGIGEVAAALGGRDPPPRTAAALGAVVADADRSVRWRSEAALLLLRARRLAAGALPADIRDTVLARRLEDETDLPAVRARPLGEALAELATRLGFPIELDARLRHLRDRPVSAEAGRIGFGARAVALARGALAEASGPPPVPIAAIIIDGRAIVTPLATDSE